MMISILQILLLAFTVSLALAQSTDEAPRDGLRKLQTVAIVKEFALVSAVTHKRLKTYPAGSTQTINLARFGEDADKISLIAILDDQSTLAKPSKIMFSMPTFPNYERNEPKAPYSACGDDNGKYKDCWILFTGRKSRKIVAKVFNDKNVVTSVASITVSVIDEPFTNVPAARSGAFVEEDGKVVWEAESQRAKQNPGYWKKRSSNRDAKGNKYTGNFYGSSYWYLDSGVGGNGVAGARAPISYYVYITTPGRYVFDIHALKDGKTFDADNDVFVKLVGGDGRQGKNTKQFISGLRTSKQWKWTSSQEIGNHKFAQALYDIPKAGNYEFVVSGRSERFRMDKFAMYLKNVYTEIGEITNIRNRHVTKRAP